MMKRWFYWIGPIALLVLCAAPVLAQGDSCPTCPVGCTPKHGGAGNELLVGTAGCDCIYGNGGNDCLLGMGGNDILCGGPGIDLLDGGDGYDQLFGNAGNDFLCGEAQDGGSHPEPGADTCQTSGSQINCEQTTSGCVKCSLVPDIDP